MPTVNIYGADDKVLMNISSIEPADGCLLIKGKILGTLPLSAKLRPEDVRAALKLMNFRSILFLLTLAFRRRQA